MNGKNIIQSFEVVGEYVFRNGNRIVLTHYASIGPDDNLVVYDKNGQRLWGIRDTYPYGGCTVLTIYEDESFFFITFYGCAYTMDSNTFEVIQKEFTK